MSDLGSGPRRLRLALGLALAATWLTVHPAVGHAATATYVVEYKGDYGYRTDLEQPTATTSVLVDETYAWDMTLATTVTDQGQATSQRTLTASGTLRRVITHGGLPVLTQSCTISALAPPGVPDLARLTLYAGAAAGSVDAHAFLPASAAPPGHLPPGGDVMVTPASDNLSGSCAGYTGTYALGCAAGTCADGCLSFPASAAWDQAFDLDVKGSAAPASTQAAGATQSNTASCSGATETGTRSIHANLTITNPGAGGGVPALPAPPGAGPAGGGAPAASAAPPTAAAPPPPADSPPPTPIVSQPPPPDRTVLAPELRRLAADVGHRCADAELGALIDRSRPRSSAASGLDRLAAVSAAELLGRRTLDCSRAFALWQETATRISAEPPDARAYAALALPRVWPAGGRSPSCPPGRQQAACRAVRLALGQYAAAAARRASLTEVTALVARRAAGARAASDRDPSAPDALALQVALARAYSGELVAASRTEVRAARALAGALAAAGLGVIQLTPATRRLAASRLAVAVPPAWLISRLVDDGLASASSLRAEFRRLVAQTPVPAALDVGSLFAAVPAGEIPAESYFALTLSDLARLARAVGDEAGRAALGADVAAAQAAATPAARLAALTRFVADARVHEEGDLATLLETAAGRLLR